MKLSSRRAWIGGLAALGVAVAASRWLLRARGADDYDSFSFLLGMRDQFDLARFQPQFPGYPVYVGLGRALIGLGVAPLDAATGLTAAASGATAVGLAVVAERLADRRAALVVGALYAVAWLPWLTGAGMLSEPLALALAVWAVALLLLSRPALAGLLAGLLLGARASYWPIVASLVVVAAYGRVAWRHLAGIVVGVAAWAPAFVLVMGARTLWTLGATHLGGHFGMWGNTVVTRPDLGLRISRFARDVFFDGLAPDWRALVVVGGCLLGAMIWSHPRRWLGVGGHSTPRKNGQESRPLRPLLFLAPYALWAFFAQNILTQPRHALPAVLGLILLAGVALSTTPIAAVLAVAAIAAVSLPLALERHTTPTGPAQAAEWAHARYGDDAPRTAIFANRSVRFFVEAARGWSLPGPWFVDNIARRSEVYVDLARVDRFPRHIVLLDEVDLQLDTPLPGALVPGPRFCRDERIDRAVPCVQVYELDWRVR